MTEMEAIQLDGPGFRALVMLFALVVAVPLAVTGLALLSADSLARTPGPMVMASVAVVSILVFGVLAGAATWRELQLSRDGLVVRSSFYRVTVERSAIRAEEIRVGDSAKDPACMLAVRTNGMSMPGFHSGWFRTRTSERAFVSLAGPRCVLVPTTKGFVLVLGTHDPEAAARTFRASLT